jgi:cytochrome c553
MTHTFSHAAALLALGLALAAPFSAVRAQSAEAGATKVALCIGCHGIPGYQSSFPEVHRVPMISGQNAGYIVASLQAYARGERRHPTMRAISGSMSEQDMADVAAFYEAEAQAGGSVLKSVAVREPSAAVAELLTKGACASCHGADYNQPIAPNYPKIAGQYADYLYVSLKAYQTENNPQVGRNNAVMSGIAKQFTPAELKQLAGYLGSLPGSLRVVPQSPFR